MAREIPEAVRAAAGLAATVLDEARRLPETLPGLPVRVLGLAMQMSMRLQQHYAGLVARGDELFTGLRGENEPGLATFDDDEEAAGLATAATRVGQSAFDRVAETVIEVTEDDGGSPAEQAMDELAIEDLVDQTPAATAADEGIAAPEPSAPEPPVSSPAAPNEAPIEGYDGWSIAQLRGRLRGYQAKTVAALVSYEESTRAREPYLRMLRNRLEKLDAQAVEASPLAPRG